MFQKVEIIGRLGRDVELQTTPTGKSVCKFSVAADHGWGDNKKTEWFNVTAWEKKAESCAQYLKKGSLVRVEGHLETREYEDKEGIRRKITDLIAHEVLFLDSKPGDNKAPWDDSKAHEPVAPMGKRTPSREF